MIDPTPAVSVGDASTFDPDRTASQPITPTAADLPPGYEYLGTLGRGGMGVVYLARHLGLNRTVALKMILAGGHADPADVARFRTEAEALARLDHPNAVKLYESGTYAGLPFFTLEYVRGGSLEAFARDPLPAADAATLVEGVARGVAHAHAAGIVHRDLKPANVLLKGVRDDGSANSTVADGSSAKGIIPKVTDFGLAKLLDGADGLTATHAIMGTPSYMAPEQARGDARGVGPAADVYALGAILYRLVTGRPPFTAPSRVGVLEQVLRDDPLPPGGLVPGLPRDIETICLKCLRKEPRDRYVTAAEVADELRRWANGESIRARPPGRVERAVKWTRRNRVVVLVMAVLTGLATAAGYSAVRAVRAERQERDARLDAEGRRDEAERQRQTAAAVKDFLEEVLTQSSARRQAEAMREGNPNLSVLEAMKYAVPRIDGRFPDRPEIEASLRHTIGLTFLDLGDLAAADPLLTRALAMREQALGPDHPDTLVSLNSLAGLYMEQGRWADAAPLLRRAVEAFTRVHGPDHPHTLAAIDNLGCAYRDADHPAAEAELRRALAGRERTLGADHADTSLSRDNLGKWYFRAGRMAEATALWERALAGRERELGPDNPDTLNSVNNLALAYQQMGRADDAERMLRRAVAGFNKVLGPDHPHTLTAHHNLGSFLFEVRARPAEAVPHIQLAVAGTERVSGRAHPDTLLSVELLSSVYLALGRPADAEPLLVRVEGFLPAGSVPHAAARMKRGTVLAQLNRRGEAEPLLRAGYAEWVKATADQSPRPLADIARTACETLAGVCAGTNRAADAATWRAEAAKYPPEALPAPRPGGRSD